jgi:integrase
VDKSLDAAHTHAQRVLHTDGAGLPVDQDHGLHRWWYRCLERAGIVAKGATSGRKIHMARHTAGQTVLDKTGNLKAVQKLLGHSSITTTGDIYTDWDIEQLAETMREVLEEGESESFPPAPAAGIRAWQESNLRPRAPEARALSPELQALVGPV